MKIRQQALKSARIEMLPLIDIVFLLLVFFIYAMLSMAVHRGLQLDLPESTEAKGSGRSSTSLFIRNGTQGMELFYKDRPIVITELGGELSALYQGAGHKPELLVFAEEQISYQELYTVLDELKRIGVETVSLQASVE